MLGLPGLTGTQGMGQLSPGDPIIDPNANPALGPMSSGGPEPDQASLEQLIAMLKMMGTGGAASGIPFGPGGEGLPGQAPPGGAVQTGTPAMPGPRGLPGSIPGPGGAGPPGMPTGAPAIHPMNPAVNPLLMAMR
jgi:integrin beta 8